MKTILCYGDSNTFGWDPENGCRFPRNLRWPGVLQAEAGSSVEVLEEGLNHRTTLLDDPEHEGRNGRMYLLPCLESHRPLDLVILMLGSNDMKAIFRRTPVQIAAGISELIGIIRKSPCGRGEISPEILVIPPPLPGRLSEEMQMYAGIEEKAPQLPDFYRELAIREGCLFLDTSSFLRCPDTDGVHLDAAGHRLLGQAVAELLRRLEK